MTHANKLPGCYMLAGRQIDLTVDQPAERVKSAAPAQIFGGEI